MIIKVDMNTFYNEFVSYGRGDQFSYESLEVLFDFYEEIDENWELDIIAICCEWTEYTLEDLAYDGNYGYMYTVEEYMGDNDIEDIDNVDMEDYYEELLSKVEDRCTVLRVNNNTVLIGE